MPRLTGGQIIVDHLVRENVPYAVGIPGHGCLGLVDALRERRKDIRVIQVRQELAGVHLADGYFRTAGKPLAVFTSIGPGACNTVIGVATAYVDSSAVLVLTGDTHTHMMGKGVLQEIERRHDSDFARILSPVTKRYWRATSAAQLPTIMRRAFAEMLTGRHGPALVSLPMDVQCDSADVTVRPGKRSDVLPSPDRKAIACAARTLARAKRPVILAGGGVRYARAHIELRALAEEAQAAVVTTLPAKDCFPNDHPLYGWLTGSKGTSVGLALTRKADVILAVGVRFADETACSYRHGASFSIPPTKLIQIDIDPREIGKNYPVDAPIVADAKAGLAALLDELRPLHRSPAAERKRYVAEIDRRRNAWQKDLARWEKPHRKPMMITSLLRQTRAFLSRDTIIAYSSGNTQAQILQEFPFYEPLTSLTTGGFSTMGWAFPAALGAKLARPDKPVIAIVGDGDFLMTIQELATAVQYDIPIVVIVANNSGWVAISDLQMAAYGLDREYASVFRDSAGSPFTSDIAKIAQAFGAHAERITAAAEVPGALERAFRSGKVSVIEAMTALDYPETGSPAVGWWDVPVPTYLRQRRRAYEAAKKEERL
ncbi:MAG: thiamine pyrophosphate-binding protein [Planctomycetota bacterium]